MRQMDLTLEYNGTVKEGMAYENLLAETFKSLFIRREQGRVVHVFNDGSKLFCYERSGNKIAEDCFGRIAGMRNRDGVLMT